MRYKQPDPKVAELAADGESLMSEMIKSTFRQIIEEMPVYGHCEFVSHEELWASVTVNLHFMVRTLRGTDPPDLSQAIATGRARALQGAPLPELLRAFRIGFTEVWHRFVDITTEGERGDIAALVSATTAIWALVDDYAEALTIAYRDTTADSCWRSRAGARHWSRRCSPADRPPRARCGTSPGCSTSR